MDGRLVDFLIVGAMKAGTTTLYRDLVTHPDVAMPEQKEPDTLVKFTSAEDIRSDYAALFARAGAGAIRGEASTAYTKRPVHEGVAERARDVLGGALKIVYIRRDPVERIVSHYRHEHQHRRISTPFAQALREVPDLIDFTRYDWQIAPWKEAFGEGSVLEIDLATYSADRNRVARQVIAHIGADPARLPPLDTGVIANTAHDQKRIGNPLLNSFIRSRLYQVRLKPMLPRALREAGRKAILPAADVEAVSVTDADRELIATALAGGKANAQ
jgi:hypothetical protein